MPRRADGVFFDMVSCALVHRTCQVVAAHIGHRHIMVGIRNFRVAVVSVVNWGSGRKRIDKIDNVLVNHFGYGVLCDHERVFSLLDLHNVIVKLDPTSVTAQHWDRIRQCLSVDVLDSEDEVLDSNQKRQKLEESQIVVIKPTSPHIIPHQLIEVTNHAKMEALQALVTDLRGRLCRMKYKHKKRRDVANNVMAKKVKRSQNHGAVVAVENPGSVLQIDIAPDAIRARLDTKDIVSVGLRKNILGGCCIIWPPMLAQGH